MPLHSMTAFAQVQGQADDHVAFTLTLKSVNHRFLDLHMRLPAELDALEIPLRRALKEKIARGHVEVTLALERTGAAAFTVNRDLVGGYVAAFRSAAKEFGVATEPDLNVILKMPGALAPAKAASDGLESAVLAGLDQAIAKLKEMRREEGRGIERELRERAGRLRAANAEMDGLRDAVARACFEKLEARLRELVAAHADRDRVLQEAALVAERSDIREEIVRLETHVGQFLALLEEDGEAGKKLDFLLQEMNREANTLLSKTSGVAGEGLRITELGLAMKSEIEKLREQVQNVE
ncbi:MAG: YicC family protein [Acidobacteria bacterium]|nr:YicC family protein [Acidobacteriota bacterium]